MNASTTIVTVITIIVIAAGAWWFIGQPGATVAPINVDVTNNQATSTNTGGTSTATSTGATSTAPMSATIRYNGTSFSPQSVTIARGGTVTWINDSSNRMWVATARHPDHTVYDGSNTEAHCAVSYSGAAPFDQCEAGSSYSFKFDKTGTFNFHNHSNASAFGSVVVQ